MPLTGNRWTALSWMFGGVVVACAGYALLGLPIQVTDSYGNLVQVAGRPLVPLVHNHFYSPAYLRPFLWGLLRIVYVAADGNYFAWFRGWHVAQVVALVALFLRLVRPDTLAAAAAMPLGLTALFGIHTFAGTVREAFPINTFMTVVLCCFAAADLALGPPRWWRSVSAAVLFVFAALTVESGLLVAVVLMAAYLAGGRGVSTRGAIAIVLLVCGYMFLRFQVLNVGSPGLLERSTGFGFTYRDPAELVARFGGNPLPLYAYNVATSFISVLLSEPRAGIWATTGALMEGTWEASTIMNVTASLLGTGMIVAYLWARRAAFQHWELTRGDQLMVVFVAVLGANAAISYAYTKDVILSPAGAFYALALAVAAARTLEALPRAPAWKLGAVSALLVLLAGAWAFRYVGIHVALRQTSTTMRNEWAYIDQWLAREQLQITEPHALALKAQLQDDAVSRHPARPPLIGRWVQWFED